MHPAGSFPPSIRGGARARRVSERNAPSGERRASGVSPPSVAPARVMPARLAAATARSRSIAPQLRRGLFPGTVTQIRGKRCGRIFIKKNTTEYLDIKFIYIVGSQKQLSL